VITVNENLMPEMSPLKRKIKRNEEITIILIPNNLDLCCYYRPRALTQNIKHSPSNTTFQTVRSFCLKI